MPSRKTRSFWLLLLFACLTALPMSAQSFRVQCPTSTITHPDSNNTGVNNSEPAYKGATTFTTSSAGMYMVPSANVNGAIKCQQISGGDGYATMADGAQTFMFSFGPLSGLADIANGLPGTQFPNAFNQLYTSSSTYAGSAQPLRPGDPATTDGSTDAGSWTQGNWNEAASTPFTWNGAVGLTTEVTNIVNLLAISEDANGVVTAMTDLPLGLPVGSQVNVARVSPAGYNGTFTITGVGTGLDINGGQSPTFTYTDPILGLAADTDGTGGFASSLPIEDGHVDPRQIMDVGVMNGNIPAPLMAIDEDDEFFLTLTNVGMIMRPDLFEQHTVHFHGYPNASSFYDGVPDASVAINIGGSFTYYYLAPDAGTYFWHCHITPPEHLQMGMVGQIYVRPRQNRVLVGSSLYTALQAQQNDARTACNPVYNAATNPDADILCTNSLPAVNTGMSQKLDLTGSATTNPNFNQPYKYAYNDGDGTTAYDAEYPLQIHGFDPNFHFVGMTFNPEAFVDMKDKYFLLNGRSYPDTVTSGPLATQSSDGNMHYSQPLPSIINIPVGGKALLRISDLDVSEYQTLASLGIPMTVIGYNAKLLRDQEGNNMYYKTNSITLGGGESLDVLLDASDPKYKSGQIFYLYTPNLDHLANDAENFGGLMTEIHIL